MARYGFIGEDGHRFEMVMTDAEYMALPRVDDETIIVPYNGDDIRARRDPADFGCVLTPAPQCFKIRSISLGVNNDREARAAKEQAAAAGVSVDFDPKTHDAIFASRGERNRYCKAFGYHDKDGGYSDPVPSKG